MTGSEVLFCGTEDRGNHPGGGSEGGDGRSMNVYLMVAGGIFAIGAIAEKSEKKSRRMLAGFAICVIGLVALQIL